MHQYPGFDQSRSFPTWTTISQRGLFLSPIQESLSFDFTSGRLHFAPHDNLQTLARWCSCGEGKDWNQWKISKKGKISKKKTEREDRPDPVETDIGVLPPLIVLSPLFVFFLYFSFLHQLKKNASTTDRASTVGSSCCCSTSAWWKQRVSSTQ